MILNSGMDRSLTIPLSVYANPSTALNAQIHRSGMNKNNTQKNEPKQSCKLMRWAKSIAPLKMVNMHQSMHELLSLKKYIPPVFRQMKKTSIWHHENPSMFLRSKHSDRSWQIWLSSHNALWDVLEQFSKRWSRVIQWYSDPSSRHLCGRRFESPLTMNFDSLIWFRGAYKFKQAHLSSRFKCARII